MTDVVATLSTEGERKYLSGEPTPSDSGEKALRRCDGLRFFAGAPLSEDMLPRFRGMFKFGM
jgi:hypothetical protein